MDKADVIKLVKEYANLVKDNYACDRVILFGSFARGTQHEYSDIDVAVILNSFDNPLDIQLELMRLRRKIDSRIEPHPIRLCDFEASNPLAYEIMKYGERIDDLIVA
jgi:predicted nucleotidyltransferase